MAVRQLDTEVARKIAAGEVIDRPSAIVRELLDNAVDSGARRIIVEIESGGIDKIRVIDDGCGMDKGDLFACARPHATSKISTEADLLNLTTLGFRGEALSSMAAVSRLQITSGTWRMSASVTEDHTMTQVSPVKGCIVQTAGLFENFPARRRFLKRPASEAMMCRTTFAEKAIPRPDIAFNLIIDGQDKLNLCADQTLCERFVDSMGFKESPELFYELSESSNDSKEDWSFTLILGEPAVTRNSRKDIFIYVNGRRIQEYSLVQAIEYGCQGYFPNGLHPAACLLVQMDPSLVDFNIHPAKREAKFKDLAPLHHSVSVTTRNFFKQYTVKNIIEQNDENSPQNAAFAFEGDEERYVSAPTQYENNIPHFSGRSGASVTERLIQPSYKPSHTFESDARSKFFDQKEHSLMKDFSQGMQHILDSVENASVEGHITKPNYTEQLQSEEDGFHFVGSTLGSFLIAEKNDVLYIIDQHAAHERYLYNKIMEDAGQKQALLYPYTVKTDSTSDDNYLEQLQAKLEEAGFTGKNRGNGTWEFTTVPIRWKGTEEDLKKDLLDRRITPTDMINAVAASTACRAAVKDGDVLDRDTAAWIASLALALPDPHCPHGRPVYTTITRKQLFMLVKRI